MATPASAEVIRAIAVPLLAIAAGALFLIDYGGGPSIGATWPVLLVLAGGLQVVSFLIRRGATTGSEG